MNRIKESLLFLIFTWPVGILIGVLFHFLILCGRIRVLHRERFPKWRRRIIVVSNHPSLLEPLLLPALFFKQYLFRPFRYAPWSTPDRKNYYDRWYWAWARSRLVPVNRQDKGAESRSLSRIRRILDDKGIVIIFAEGGRTFKGEKFLYSRTGKRMRELKNGVGLLVARTGAMVLPVWVEGTDEMLPNHPDKLFTGLRLNKKATIKIGRLMRLRRTRRLGYSKEITPKIAQALLELADEEE